MGLRAELKKVACDKCGAVGTMQEIIYGLPSEDFDFNKNISGGCVMSDESPSIGCSKCDWRGIHDWYTGEMNEVKDLGSN